MIIYAGAIIPMSISIYYLLEMRGFVANENRKNRNFLKIFQPIKDGESKIEMLGISYAKLKEEYKECLEKLHESESLLKLYNIGAGTTDDSLYVHKAESSTSYLTKLANNLAVTKRQIKELLSAKKACISGYIGQGITLDNRKSGATKLFNREIKLRLRCLDNEFKMAGALIDWHNVNRLIQRCEKAYSDINKSGEKVKTFIQSEYLKLKLKELKLGFQITTMQSEIREKVRAELRIIRDAEREEARLKAATAKAIEEREKMEKLVASEIQKYAAGTDEQKKLLEEHKQLLEDLKNTEKRALSMAQRTRAGFVYVISNINSFGKGICKIGMTRRLDPYDRVKELGDASVPDTFEVHAFAFSEDAPKLESILHEKFSNKRVNLVNKRKEYFMIDPKSILSYLQKNKKGIDLQVFG